MLYYLFINLKIIEINNNCLIIEKLSGLLIFLIYNIFIDFYKVKEIFSLNFFSEIIKFKCLFFLIQYICIFI